MGAGRPACGRRQAKNVTDLIATASRFLCRSEEIAEGQARAFPPHEGSRDKLILVRRRGALYAYWDACPHYGDTPMAWRANEYLNADRNRLVCASHGAEFEIETGRCVLGAALGKSLRAALIEIDAAGEVRLSQHEYREA